MQFENLLLQVSEGVAILTVNRPQSLNALNLQLLSELECAFHQLDHDPAVKAVVITGSGEKAFVAGADIREMAGLDPLQAHRFAQKGQGILLALEKMKKPVIAAVNGYALGGGLELALACDFIYASEKAKFGLPEVTLGIMPGFGGTQNLSRLIGPGRAKEMIFSGRMISAEKAASWGIVNEVFAADELLAKATETAAAIAGVGVVAVGQAKDAIVNGLNMAKEDGLRYEASLFGGLFATKDQREGMTAFVEKRPARFTGQ